MKSARISALVLMLLSLALVAAFPGLAAEEPISIGADLELSGAISAAGLDCAKAAALAFEQVNARGGLLGRPVKLITFDNQSDPAEAMTGASKLITQDRVVALIGPVTSTNSLSAGPVAKDRGIPMITPAATNPKVTQVSEFIFRACFIDDFQGEVMAAFALRSLKVKRAAIFIDQSSDYSKGLARFFKQKFTALGGTIVTEQGFMPEDRDFTAQLRAAKAEKAQVIYAPCYYEPAGIITRQARQAKMMIPILGGDGWDFPNELTKAANPKDLNQIYYTNHYSSDATSPQNREFVKAYKARYGQVPTSLSALGYDAATLLIDAIRRAGNADPRSIREALASTPGFPGVTGRIRFDRSRNPIKSAVVVQLVNGVPQFKDEVEP